MGVCTNTRRVKREVLERAVLDQIAVHLAEPAVLEPCLSEYRQQVVLAQAELVGKAATVQARLEAIEPELEKLMDELGQADDTPLAKRLMRQRIERLGQEQELLQRRLEAPTVDVKSLPDGATVAERLAHRMADLQSLLASHDREAVRAKEVLRGLFDQVTLTPTPGTEVDGRGAGPLTVTVVGQLAAVLGLADVEVNRRTKAGSDPETGFGAVIEEYRFSFRHEPRDPRLRQAFLDLPILSRLLDDAEVPVTMEAFRVALDEANGSPVPKEEADARLRHALAYLRRQGMVRRPSGHKRWSGYVWNHIDRSDAEWWELAQREKPAGYRLPTLRLVAPGARVVVTGPKEPDKPK